MKSRGGAGGDDSDDDVLMSASMPPVSTPEVAVRHLTKERIMLD